MSQTKSITLSPSTTINFTVSGTPSSFPSIIFLHFWGGSSRTFAQLTSHLPQFHCIAIDFPGWGSSTGAQDPNAYSIAHLALDIETLIPKLNIKDFVLVGHSMGGKVSQLIAGRNLVKGLKGVILLAPAPPTPLVLPGEMKEQQLAAYSSPQSAEFVVRNVLSSSPLTSQTVEGLVEDMMRGSEFAKAAWPAYAMGEDVLEEARKINVPVLVVAGEEDRVETVERVRREVLENVKGEIVVLDEKGHLLPVEAPGEVAGLVRAFVVKIGVRK